MTMVTILIFSFPPFLNTLRVLKVLKKYGDVSHNRCERNSRKDNTQGNSGKHIKYTFGCSTVHIHYP